MAWLWLQPVPPPFGSCCSARGRPADQNTEHNGGAAVSARFGLGDRMVDSQSPEERKIENPAAVGAGGLSMGLKLLGMRPEMEGKADGRLARA